MLSDPDRKVWTDSSVEVFFKRLKEDEGGADDADAAIEGPRTIFPDSTLAIKTDLASAPLLTTYAIFGLA